MKVVSHITYEIAKKDYEDTLAFYGRKPQKKTYFGTLDEVRNSYKDAHPALFSNENNSYLKACGIPKNASAFIIGASYDNAIDLVGLGATNIYSIDMNQKQFYIEWMKLYAMLYLSYQEYYAFLVDPHTDCYLNSNTIEYILNKAPDCPAKMYWYLVLSGGGKQLLQDYFLLDERLFKEPDTYRYTPYIYLKNQILYDETRKRLEDAYFQFQTMDVLNTKKLGLPEKIFDCALLSNVHNYIVPKKFYEIVCEDIFPLMKQSGWVSYYEIERKPEWFSDIKKGNSPRILDSDFSSALAREMIRTQLQMSFELFELFKEGGYPSDIYSVTSGWGLRKVKTDKDSVIVLRK